MVSKLKKKAWELFSRWIRLREADDFGMVTCVTCGKRAHYKEMQAGHFVPGRHNSILFHPKNCHVQCYHCNIGLRGNPRKYDAYMKKRYGQEVIDELDKLDGVSHPFTVGELETLIEALKKDLKKWK